MPLNDMWGELLGWPFNRWLTYPEYMLAVFVMPLFYGAWRFVLMHAAMGPVLATMLTDTSNEMPAIWCLFSVGLLLIGLSPMVRRRMAPT
jgi:hypothetical protein